MALRARKVSGAFEKRVPGRNRIRATLVGVERSHHCVIAAPVYSRVHSHLHMRPSLIKRPPSQN